MEQVTVGQRVAGALSLLACGDALGAPFVGNPRVAMGAVDTVLAGRGRPLRWTGCTALSLVVAEHVTRHGGSLDPDALGYEVAALRQRPRGGPAVARWSTMPPERTGLHSDRGSAVSTAPIGLVPGWPPSVVAGQARRATRVIGDDALVGDAAALVAVAVALAAQRSGPVEPAAFVAGVAAHVPDGGVTRALRQVPALVGSQAAPGRVAATLSEHRPPVRPALVAVAAFLRHQHSPWLAIRFAIGAGGDTVTAAAATGALGGAYLGQQQVPPQWAARLAGQVRLATTAAALAGLRSPARTGGGHRQRLNRQAGPAVGIGDRPHAGAIGGEKGY